MALSKLAGSDLLNCHPFLFLRDMNDYSLFINSSRRSFTTLLVYVDDIVLAGNDKEEIERVKEALNKTFKIKDLVDLRYFLV